jgi:hypothetical protein
LGTAVRFLLRELAREISGVKTNAPEFLHTEHVTVKEDERLHGERVGGDVIDAFDAVSIRLGARHELLETRAESSVVGALDVAERDVAERRGDLE